MAGNVSPCIVIRMTINTAVDFWSGLDEERIKQLFHASLATHKKSLVAIA